MRGKARDGARTKASLGDMQPPWKERRRLCLMSHPKEESSAVLALGAPEDTVTFLKRLTYQPECFIASRRTLTYGSTKTVRSMCVRKCSTK